MHDPHRPVSGPYSPADIQRRLALGKIDRNTRMDCGDGKSWMLLIDDASPRPSGSQKTALGEQRRRDTAYPWARRLVSLGSTSLFAGALFSCFPQHLKNTLLSSFNLEESSFLNLDSTVYLALAGALLRAFGNILVDVFEESHLPGSQTPKTQTERHPMVPPCPGKTGPSPLPETVAHSRPNPSQITETTAPVEPTPPET